MAFDPPLTGSASTSAAPDAAAPLREAWYYAVPSRRLRRRAMLGKVMLGEPILIGRGADGVVFALRDPCPHRGMPLSAGIKVHCPAVSKRQP